MTFEQIVDQALEMVRRRGQVSYRMIKRQFHLDDDVLEDLKEEILYYYFVSCDSKRYPSIKQEDSHECACQSQHASRVG
jgi:hypothetical protein